MITTIQHDLLTLDCDVIAHQVNCQGVMGAGLAKQIRTRYPNVYEKYCNACTRFPATDLLGKIQIITTPNKPKIANLFAQQYYGRDRKHTSYDALRMCFIKLRDYALTNNLTTIGLPYGIGCGLAGGDWKIVTRLIEDIFKPSKLTVYICKL